MFGVNYTLKTRGEDKFRTAIGGCLTLLTICVISVVSFVFGTDFYYKQNPNVLNNEKDNDKRQELVLDQNEHPFMIRLQANAYIKEGTIKLLARYSDYRINDQGKEETSCAISDAVTNCASTTLKSDPKFINEDLSVWSCVDFEKVTRLCREKTGDPTYKPVIGGTIGDDRIGNIFIGVGNNRCIAAFRHGLQAGCGP